MKQAMTEIVGNEELKSRLCRDILASSLSHAYILEGADGSGRQSVALMAAAGLSCSQKDSQSDPIPCLACPECKKILEGKSPDVIILGSEGKATVGIDIIRFLKEDVHIIPNDTEHKIYIIRDADKMTAQAQNALLLTLEEPPSFVHFFLICNNSDMLLETIRSRAPVLRTELLDDNDVDSYISSHDRRAAQMKLSSPNEYQELIKASGGGIGKALALLDAKAWKAEKEVRSLAYSFVLSAISDRNARSILPLLSKLSTKRDILSQQLNLICNAIRDLILLKKSETAYLRFYCNVNEAIELCDRASLAFLFKLEKAVYTAIEENRRNANVRLLLTKMAISAELI